MTSEGILQLKRLGRLPAESDPDPGDDYYEAYSVGICVHFRESIL